MPPKRGTKNAKKGGEGEEAPAGPSAPIPELPAPPAQTFGTGVIHDQPFDFTTVAETNALSRLKRKEEELVQTQKQYHDIIVNREERIDALEKSYNSLKNDLSNLRTEHNDSVKTSNVYKEEAEKATAAKQKALQDLEVQKAVSDIDRTDAEAHRKTNAEQAKKITTLNEVNAKFKTRVSEQGASLTEAHTKLEEAEKEREALRTANLNLAATIAKTEEDVAAATKDFEDMFKDLGRELDLTGYVSHIRDLHSSGQLKRQDSSLSLQRQLSPNKSNQELPNITGTSLQDQLAAADDRSSERSIPSGEADAEDDDDQDETLTSLGLGKTWDTQKWLIQLKNQEQKIIELENLNKQLQDQVNSQPATTPQNFGFSGIQSVTTAPIKPISATAHQAVQTSPVATAPANLEFSSIQSVDTEPIPGPAAPPPIVKTGHTVHTPTPAELWQQLPFWTKLVVLMMLGLFVALFASNMSERYLWYSANDLTRQAVILGSEGGLIGLLAPVLTHIDALVGVENTPFG